MKIQTKQKYVLLAGMTGFVLEICSAKSLDEGVYTRHWNF